VQLVRGGDREQAAERVNMLSGKNQMDALRESMASFREAEERLDDERQQQLAGAREELQWVLRGGTGASLLMTLLLVAVFARSIGSRLAALRDNAKILAQGQDRFAAVGGNDEIAQVDQVFRQAARDLTAAHAALESQSRLLQSVLDSMGEGVVVADEQGKFLIFNPAAERLLGWGRSRAVQRVVKPIPHVFARPENPLSAAGPSARAGHARGDGGRSRALYPSSRVFGTDGSPSARLVRAVKGARQRRSALRIARTMDIELGCVHRSPRMARASGRSCGG